MPITLCNKRGETEWTQEVVTVRNLEDLGAVDRQACIFLRPCSPVRTLAFVFYFLI